MESIKENRTFKRAYNRGKKQAGNLLVLYYFYNKATNIYGITTSKKIGKAVKRNRVRRLIRESIRSYEGQIKQGYDIVVVARGSAVSADFLQIQKCLYQLLERAELLIQE